MLDESMEILKKRIQQIVGLIEKLKEENENLKSLTIKMEKKLKWKK